MALPPEQINIKRRREEEPVETLFIQSAIHQTKRRFTDFVFERVTLKANQSLDGTSSPPPPHPAAQRLLRSPRSVSSLHVKRRAPASSTGVPTVRATSPGAEFREAQRIATARKEAEEKHKQAIYSGPNPFSDLPILPGPGSNVPNAPRARSLARAESPSRLQALRRFQISRSAPGSLRGLGGVQKRKGDGPAPGIAVLVEQLQRNPHSRKSSMVSDLIAEGQTHSRGISASALSKELVADPVASSPTKARKRPVVNQAEKRFRQQRRGTISNAKQNLSDSLERSAQSQESNWDEESDRLAQEFEQVALELEQDQEQDHGMDLDSRAVAQPAAPNPQPVLSSGPRTPLKHQPRQPKEPRVAPPPVAPQAAKDGEAVEEDEESDYVYDVYVRRPITETELKNPLAEYESEQQQKSVTKSQPGVGVIVITVEDEKLWEDFVEDDEEEWDSEDADSNAENNPANDYPDEEVSSDDDEFDFDDSASEDGGEGYMSRWRGPVDSDDEY